jgi:2-polyprenyl-3-methyl-5-hydroxy-6-metoxy-1,4-benzoquinol methylase
MENRSKELERLNQTSDIYTTEAGKLNQDIISYNSAELIKLRKLTGGRAIQLGLGDGYIAGLLAKEYKEFVILEGSDNVIRDFYNKDAGYTVVKTLFEEYEAKEKFDVLLGNHILEHVDDPVGIMRQAKKSLKPGAKAIFSVPHADSLHRRIGVEMNLLKQRNELNGQDIQLGHRRVYTIKEFEADIKSAGFKILETRGYMIKLVSNAQMKGWSRELLDAIFKISLEAPSEICSNIAVICEA